MVSEDIDSNLPEADAAAGGPAEHGDTDPSLTEEQRIELIRRRSMASAADDGDASHQGGMGAQGGAADFGMPKNFGLPS